MKDLRRALKTPLRYPGGKSRAVTKMDQYFPDLRNYVEFREPFLGGGSVALYISKKYPHLKITVNDLYEPLVNFWSNLQMFGVEMKDQLLDYKLTHNDPDSARELFNNSKDLLGKTSESSIDRAVAFILSISAVLVVSLRALVFHLKLPGAIFQYGGLRNYLDTKK